MNAVRTSAGWLRLTIGLGILALLVAYLGPATLAQHLATAEPAWLVLAGLVLVLATLLGAVNLYLLLPATGRPPLSGFVGLFWIAWAVGLVVPGQVGDMGAIAVGLRRRGYPWHTAIGRNLLDKGLTLAVLAALATWGLWRWFGSAKALAVLVGLSAVGLLVVLGALWLAGALPVRLALRARQALDLAVAALADARITARLYPGLVALNAVLTVVKFALVTAAYGCVLGSIGVRGVAVTDLLSVVAASSLIAYIPVTANGVGTAEAAGVALFGALGIPAAAVLSAYILLRLLVMALAWVPVGFWLAFARQARG